MKNEKDWKKWLFWFSFAIAAIAIYKLLDNFTDIVNTIGNFLQVLKPFILGVILAYLLYIPASRIEKGLRNSKKKFIKKKLIKIYLFKVL